MEIVLTIGDISVILVENVILIEGNIAEIHTQLPVMKIPESRLKAFRSISVLQELSKEYRKKKFN